MKKFGGFLLILLGTGLIVWGAWAAGAWSSIPISVIAIICGVFGVAFILKGRKLYLANGESPKAKKVAGRVLIIIGLGLAVFGILWYISEGRSSYSTAGDWNLVLASLAAAFGFLIAGAAKSHAAKKGARQATVNSATAPARTNAASSQPPMPTPSPQPKMMICKECGKKYPLNQVYCEECGSLLKES